MSRPIFESTNHPLRRNRQRIRKIPLKSTISEGFWSEWRDSNARLPHPKCGALPTGLHPDIQFLSLYHGGEENQRFFCLWSFMWSKAILCRFLQSEKIPQMQASQGFAAFHLTPSRIPTRHSQSRRATNCATPGYFVILSGWSYAPKPGAIPTSLYPDTFLVYHSCGWKGRENFWFT